ncbi:MULTISPECIES: hypothetical protein [Bacillales]|uniref:Uncharacterized protein n=1 Tax=Bacillus fungorum TaxID=2039284 RepID=A0A2G6Q4M6_9BACI|nr:MULTISPECIES: hypothetical protein [Bacillales]WAI30029.1 MAG: hypothetical protein NRZ50_30995 [Bacillus paranthracis]MBK3313471.1 hypothetical protein [Staphylococcus aureus]PIE91753.1 hypothetical protein CO726_30435 [Bacillus fungorum]WAI35838.1 MAG: hypothetical protein NRZ52_30905 [Bacillus paranthracis]WAI41679.1 MAG: hypothetical protein NRZ51_31000 [Bacillus paranthracis]
MAKPLFCPNCGVKLIDEDFYVKSFTSYETKDRNNNVVVIDLNGWGCECASCNWEGDILPYDEDTEYN